VAQLERAGGLENIKRAAEAGKMLRPLEVQRAQLKAQNNKRRIVLHALRLEGVKTPSGLMFFSAGKLPPDMHGDGEAWRFSRISGNRVVLSSGGAVVGYIPAGLPRFAVPALDWSLMLALLPSALVMALIGFMEATSISKAIATTTGERIDASKELVGQGLANIADSFFGAYTVSGSFSRSAVAARTGAKTGLFAIVSALAVMLVLLFFTQYLYALPQAVLAVIVMMAVFGLIRVAPLVHAWKVDRLDAIIGLITFVTTSLMAPAIANGILLGIVSTLLAFLVKSMRPRAEIVAYKPDGTLAGIKTHALEPLSQRLVPVRFDGSLTFANVSYFEDVILEVIASYPKVKAVLVIGSGINAIDASGEEKMREISEHLRQAGIELYFSGLKHQVLTSHKRSGLVDRLGAGRFFASKKQALDILLERFA